MVEVRIRRDSRQRLSSFSARGHAGWAEHGSDVVCSAVSAILQTAQLGLSEVAGVDVRARKDEGRLDLHWPPAARASTKVAAIVETAALAIDRLARQYPDHVRAVYEPEPAGERSGRAAKGAS